ncbi:MAG TPA: di-heme oxidoredictase family protein [Planctomycetota bacterium]|nr:di-heme oxidoredictase family protein [Planctomycetota bacterium]
MKIARGVLGLALACAAAQAQGGYQPRMGEPVNGLSAAELQLFLEGKAAFAKALVESEGLGPIFNDVGCGACHSDPAMGGSSVRTVTRFGKKATATSPFDPLANIGGSLLQVQAIAQGCEEVVPPAADVTAERITPSTFGSGLVEAIADADILALAANPPPGVSGIATSVGTLENPMGPMRVGRFGWKSQLATVMSFSIDASNNEMGLTNVFLPDEQIPNGRPPKLAACDAVPDPEDRPDSQGFTLADRFTIFQRLLAPPPQTPRSGMTGEILFQSAGCAACHVETGFVTGPAPEPVLSGVAIKPYSDFLLHDMGALGDGIVQGAGTENELITRSLWGLISRNALLHDGRATGGSFEQNVRDAIAHHDGEAAAARDAFANLSGLDQQLLLDFLGSLGRAEFDYEGDNDVDEFDWFFIEPSFTGPGAFYTPDDFASISDVDQDGDFDLADFAVLQRAFTGTLAPEPPQVAPSDLALDAASAGQASVQVQPGASVPWEVTALLSDSASEGLALVAFDLEFTGGTLSPAAAPAGAMASFASPQGLSNPAGFGGTQSAGKLLQVGGGQNTIRQSFAPQPKGTVTTGVALPGAPQVIAAGTLTAPTAPGTYRLELSNALANVIRLGETGDPHWRADPVHAIGTSELTIVVVDCQPSAYCTAKTSSLGCTPAIGWSGTPTLTGADDLHLSASSLIGKSQGLLWWSAAPASLPFLGGTLCVQQPAVKTPVQPTGGSAGTCSGALDFHFTQAYMAGQGLTAGSSVYAQWLYRDRQHPDGTGAGLSDALHFAICP